MRVARRSALAAALALQSVLCAAAVAADPAAVCRADKVLRAGLYDLCLMRATARAVRRGEAPELGKCHEQFGLAWAKVEAKAGGDCPTSGDSAAIAGQVQADVAALLAALTPASTTTTTTSTSTTLPIPCGGAAFPGCGGSCPAGLSCWAAVGPGVPGPTLDCVCRPAVSAPCADTAGPVFEGVCGGACPAGEACSTLWVDDGTFDATCGCIPQGTTPCLSSDAPVCGGSCPPGLTCDESILFACACQ